MNQSINPNQITQIPVALPVSNRRNSATNGQNTEIRWQFATGTAPTQCHWNGSSLVMIIIIIIIIVIIITVIIIIIIIIIITVIIIIIKKKYYKWVLLLTFLYLRLLFKSLIKFHFKKLKIKLYIILYYLVNIWFFIRISNL